MNTKKKKGISAYRRASDRMLKETARAIAHVKMLEELYQQVQNERKPLPPKDLR